MASDETQGGEWEIGRFKLSPGFRAGVNPHTLRGRFERSNSPRNESPLLPIYDINKLLLSFSRFKITLADSIHLLFHFDTYFSGFSVSR